MSAGGGVVFGPPGGGTSSAFLRGEGGGIKDKTGNFSRFQFLAYSYSYNFPSIFGFVTNILI